MKKMIRVIHSLLVLLALPSFLYAQDSLRQKYPQHFSAGIGSGPGQIAYSQSTSLKNVSNNGNRVFGGSSYVDTILPAKNQLQLTLSYEFQFHKHFQVQVNLDYSTYRCSSPWMVQNNYDVVYYRNSPGNPPDSISSKYINSISYKDKLTLGQLMPSVGLGFVKSNGPIRVELITNIGLIVPLKYKVERVYADENKGLGNETILQEKPQAVTLLRLKLNYALDPQHSLFISAGNWFALGNLSMSSSFYNLNGTLSQVSLSNYHSSLFSLGYTFTLNSLSE